MEKFTIIKIILFLALLIIFTILYVPDVEQKYRAKATTITTKRETIENIIWPAFTFCMEKPYKPSVLLEEFEKIPNRNIFTSNDNRIKYNESLEKLYRKATYLRGRDFKFTLNGKDDEFTVEELPTEDYGMCYTILRKNQTSGSRILFGIIPKPELMNHQEDNPKGVSIFITTENTRYFLINGLWPLKPLIISKRFSPKYYMKAKVEEIEWKYYDGNPDCHLGCKMNQCLKWSEILEANDKCKKLCVPIVLSGLYKNLSEPICNTLWENTCMYRNYRKLRGKKVANCGPPQNDIQFDAYVKDDEYLTRTNDKDTIYAGIDLSSNSKVVKEEILIYDNLSLIGTLGGTLGLMIGFSFFGCIDYVLSKIFRK